VKRRGKISIERSSTSMGVMDGAVFCEFLDRLITWASHPDGRNLVIPMSDPDWKWRRHYEELQNAAK
jgi:hypothetical protein